MGYLFGNRIERGNKTTDPTVLEQSQNTLRIGLGGWKLSFFFVFLFISLGILSITLPLWGGEKYYRTNLLVHRFILTPNQLDVIEENYFGYERMIFRIPLPEPRSSLFSLTEGSAVTSRRKKSRIPSKEWKITATLEKPLSTYLTQPVETSYNYFVRRQNLNKEQITLLSFYHKFEALEWLTFLNAYPSVTDREVRQLSQDVLALKKESPPTREEPNSRASQYFLYLSSSEPYNRDTNNEIVIVEKQWKNSGVFLGLCAIFYGSFVFMAVYLLVAAIDVLRCSVVFNYTFDSSAQLLIEKKSFLAFPWPTIKEETSMVIPYSSFISLRCLEKFEVEKHKPREIQQNALTGTTDEEVVRSSDDGRSALRKRTKQSSSIEEPIKEEPSSSAVSRETSGESKGTIVGYDLYLVRRDHNEEVRSFHLFTVKTKHEADVWGKRLFEFIRQAVPTFEAENARETN